MGTNTVLSCEDLKQITGYQRPGDVARCLRDQGVQVFQGRLGPWTTIELINQAGGLTPASSNDTLEATDIL
ncbi:DUF4224 domain-containing protein [Vreelandella janggokensis]|uniref:DUF4224 domain-containing protein n=1 Tax=Vreelandella janggokensis TaxID=370767 RepID=UPI0028676945|nr:hypothetical protein [Halomonas janggokensis]MDR5887518.1 DUF4224 domain-containing protein [Halomonas janggokensis]